MTPERLQTANANARLDAARLRDGAARLRAALERLIDEGLAGEDVARVMDSPGYRRAVAALA